MTVDPLTASEPPPGDCGTPIADELAHGPSAARYVPDGEGDGEGDGAITAGPNPAEPSDVKEGEPEGVAVDTEVEIEDEPFSAQLARARTAPRTSTRPEGAITAECLDWLNAQPRTKARKVHQGPTTGGGEPDIDACSRGRAVKIEIKRPGQRPEPRQMRRMQEWQKAGALVGWACSLADIQALMQHVPDLTWQNPLSGPGCPDAP